MFRRYIRGAVGLAKAGLGIDPAHPRVIVARRQRCAPCPMQHRGRCRACGCVIKAKTMIRDESCPKGMW